MFLAGLLGKVINSRAGAGEYKMGLEYLVGQKIRKCCKNDRVCQKNTGANLNGQSWNNFSNKINNDSIRF